MYEYLNQNFNDMSPNEAKEIVDMFEFLNGAPKVTLAFRSTYGALERLIQDVILLQEKLDKYEPAVVEDVEPVAVKERKPRKPKAAKIKP